MWQFAVKAEIYNKTKICDKAEIDDKAKIGDAIEQRCDIALGDRIGEKK